MPILISHSGIWRNLQRASTSRKTAYALAILAILSGAATVLTIVERPGQTSDIKTVLSLLYIDGILFVLLGAVVARRLAQVWSDRRRGAAGQVGGAVQPCRGHPGHFGGGIFGTFSSFRHAELVRRTRPNCVKPISGGCASLFGRPPPYYRSRCLRLSQRIERQCVPIDAKPRLV